MIKKLALLFVFTLSMSAYSAVYSDGANDGISTSTNADLEPGTDSFTYMAWAQSNGSGPQVVSKWNSTGGTSFFDFFITDSGEEVNWRLRDSAGNGDPGLVANMSSDTWHHYAGVIDRSDDSFHGYVDGVEVSTGDISSVGDIDCDGPFTIGYRVVGGTPANYYEGYVDDVRIYNRALNAAEIESIALSRSRIHLTDGLVGHWTLDQGVEGVSVEGASSVLDRSGNDYHGSPNDAPTWTSSTGVSNP